MEHAPVHLAARWQSGRDHRAAEELRKITGAVSGRLRSGFSRIARKWLKSGSCPTDPFFSALRDIVRREVADVMQSFHTLTGPTTSKRAGA